MADLSTVAEEMARIALAARTASKADVFGRSAFNRYYYAAFLIVRQMLASMDPKWAGWAHSNIPEQLQGVVLRRVKGAVRKQVQEGLLLQGEGRRLQSQAANAVSRLADLLSHSYSVRCKADYAPEETAEREGAELRLAACTLTAARKWPSDVGRFSGLLLSAWRAIGF